AAQDRAGADRHPRRGGRAGVAPGVRGAEARARAGRTDARVAGRGAGRRAGRDRPRAGRRRDRTGGGRAMSTRTLAVVSAGLSVPSSTRLLADRLTTATVDALRQRGVEATVEVVERREHARDLADNLVTGFPSGSLRAALDTVTGADGLIAVTPIFSASYSGLFKTLFDVVYTHVLTRQHRT